MSIAENQVDGYIFFLVASNAVNCSQLGWIPQIIRQIFYSNCTTKLIKVINRPLVFKFQIKVLFKS